MSPQITGKTGNLPHGGRRSALIFWTEPFHTLVRMLFDRRNCVSLMLFPLPHLPFLVEENTGPESWLELLLSGQESTFFSYHQSTQNTESTIIPQ